MAKKHTSTRKAIQAPTSNDNTKVVSTPYRTPKSSLETAKMGEKGEGLSPILSNRYASLILMFLGCFNRFRLVVNRVGCNTMELFVIWLFVASCGSVGCTLHGLCRGLGLVWSNNSVNTLKYNVKTLKDVGLLSMSLRARYTTYTITRYAEKKLFDFEIAKKDIVSFVKQFRDVVKHNH